MRGPLEEVARCRAWLTATRSQDRHEAPLHLGFHDFSYFVGLSEAGAVVQACWRA